MYSTMLVVCFLLTMLELIHSQSCPAKYRKLSKNHSYCLTRNPRCKIFSSGIKKKEIDEILKIHNTLRSKIALGLVNKKGEITKDASQSKFPKAADMMEMVWDDELSATAQKWVEQCKFKHDCNECRATPKYSVGQNIAIKKFSCPKGDCSALDKKHARDWTGRIKDLFSEVIDAPKSALKSYHKVGRPIGHFTQVIWASSWKIGCGFVSYEDENVYHQFYACNYGPSGNWQDESVYSFGKPCSKCPANSCCGRKCNPPALPGLCRESKKKGRK